MSEDTKAFLLVGGIAVVLLLVPAVIAQAATPIEEEN